MSGVSLTLTKSNPSGLNFLSNNAPISLQAPSISLTSPQTTLSGALLTGGNTVVAGALTAVLPSGGNNLLGYTKFANNIDVANTVNAPNANLTVINASTLTTALNTTVQGALSVTGNATVSGSTTVQALNATTTTLSGVLSCQSSVSMATTLTIGTSLTVPTANIQNMSVSSASMDSMTCSSLTANGSSPLSLTGKDASKTVVINSLLQTSNITAPATTVLQLAGQDSSKTTDVLGRLTVDTIQPHTSAGALSLACPVVFTSTLTGPQCLVQNAYVQDNVSNDPTVNASLNFSRTGFGLPYKGSISMVPNAGLQTKVNGVVVSTVNPTNSVTLFPMTVQLSQPLQVNGVLATNNSPLVLQGGDGPLTVDCVGMLKADTIRAHTSGGSVTISDPIAFGTATGSAVAANSVYVQNKTSSDAGVNAYVTYDRSGYGNAFTASAGINPSKGGYVLNVNGRQVYSADTQVGNVTFGQGVVVQGGQTIAGALTVAGGTGLSNLTVSGSIGLPDLLSNFTGKLSQIKNDGVAFNPNATADLYMNNYNIYTATTVNSATCNATAGNFAQVYVGNKTDKDPTDKALVAYDRSGYDTTQKAYHGIDPSVGAYVLSVNGRNIYTASTGNGNCVFSQGVGVNGNLTVAGGFNYVPVGSMTQFAGSTAPAGFLICDGSAISRANYTALFSVIGTMYGSGDGSSTFNIPNFKGRVAAGLNSNDSNFQNMALAGGSSTHTLTLNEMPSHSHSVSDTGHNHTLHDNGHQHYYNAHDDSGGGTEGGNGQAAGITITRKLTSSQGAGITIDSGQANMTCASAGQDQAHSILQPYLVVLYIIKV